MPQLYLSIIALFLLFFNISCAKEVVNSSPEQTAQAFLQATTEGNIDAMQGLTVQELHDDEVLGWLVTRLESILVADLTIHAEDNDSWDDTLSIYTVHSGSTQITTLYIAPVGNLYFVMRVYPPDSGF